MTKRRFVFIGAGIAGFVLTIIGMHSQSRATTSVSAKYQSAAAMQPQMYEMSSLSQSWKQLSQRGELGSWWETDQWRFFRQESDSETLFFDDFDGGYFPPGPPPVWRFVNVKAVGVWHPSPFNAYQGGISWWCGDTLSNVDFCQSDTVTGYMNSWYQVLDTDPILLTGTTAELRFYQRYAVEEPGGEPSGYSGWDGMNIRISTDGGSTFGVLVNPTPSYTNTSLFGFGDEQCEGVGVPGWCGYATTWHHVSHDLAGYIGETVIIRFAFASDPCYSTQYEDSTFCGPGGPNPDMQGWNVDDITVVADGSVTLFFNDATSTINMHPADNNSGAVWDSSTVQAYSGVTSMLCGDDWGTRSYLETPDIYIPDTGSVPWDIFFGYRVYANLLDADGDGNNALDDYWHVQISRDGGCTWIPFGYDYRGFYEEDTVGIPPGGSVWVNRYSCFNGVIPISLNLYKFRGDTIRIRWYMNTDCNDDGCERYDAEGLYIDDFLVYYVLPPWDDNVSCWSLVTPGRGIYPYCDVRPKAVVRNFGRNPQVFVPVVCEIDSVGGGRVYADTQWITQLFPGTKFTVEFDPFYHTECNDVGDRYEITMFTMLSGDEYTGDDTCQTYEAVTTRLNRWDDGQAEVAWCYPSAGHWFGVDFECPCPPCTLQEVWWMISADSPDADREEIRLAVFNVVDGVPDEDPIDGYDITITSDEVYPDWDKWELNPPLALTTCHYLIGMQQRTNSPDCEALCADTNWLSWGQGAAYWDDCWLRLEIEGLPSRWVKIPNDTVFFNLGNLMLRGLLACAEPGAPARNAAAWAINTPGPSVYPGCSYDVQGTVKNAGTETVSFDVRCLIVIEASGDTVFDTTVNVGPIDYKKYVDVDFGQWTPDTTGGGFDIGYAIMMITLLTGEECASNDTATSTAHSDDETYWDDGSMGDENALIFYEAGGRFGVDFYTPSCSCWVKKVKWMVHADWPDGSGTHPVDLEIYDLSDTSVIWSVSNVPTTETEPMWNEYAVVPAETLPGERFLVAVVQRSDTPNCDGMGIDVGRYWRHDWTKASGAEWESPAYWGNFMIRAEIECTVKVPPPEKFIRGDCTGATIGYGDGTMAMSDAIYILKVLYVPGTPAPMCDDALDVNDDAGWAMSDAVYLLKALYVPGSPMPPAPYPACGSDPTTGDPYDCGDHSCQAPPKASSSERQVDGKMLFGYATIQDQKVIVPVYLENNRSLSGFAYTVSYDTEVLSFKCADNTKLTTANFDFFSARPNEELGLVSVGGLVDMELKRNLTPGHNQVATLIFELKTDEFRETVLKFTDVELVNTEARPVSAHTNTCTIRIPFSIPKVFGLSQNYPNPVKDWTAIRYQLPKFAHTTLRIYNSAGQVVKTLVDEVKNPGYYSEVWNGKDNLGRKVSSGVYFYQLKTDEYTKVRKLVVVQ